MAIEIAGGQFGGWPCRTNLPALAAGRPLVRAHCRKAIDRVAMRADDVQIIAHDASFVSENSDIRAAARVSEIWPRALWPAGLKWPARPNRLSLSMASQQGGARQRAVRLPAIAGPRSAPEYSGTFGHFEERGLGLDGDFFEGFQAVSATSPGQMTSTRRVPALASASKRRRRYRVVAAIQPCRSATGSRSCTVPARDSAVQPAGARFHALCSSRGSPSSRLRRGRPEADDRLVAAGERAVPHPVLAHGLFKRLNVVQVVVKLRTKRISG